MSEDSKMSNCHIRGCRNLEKKCKDCGRLVCDYQMPKSEWIKVKHRLPKENQEIIMTYNDLVMEGKFLNNKFYHPSVCAHVQGYCNCEEQEGITHWMPLPDAPHE